MGFATPKLNGTLMIELKVALANAVLAVVTYWIFSWGGANGVKPMHIAIYKNSFIV